MKMLPSSVTDDEVIFNSIIISPGQAEFPRQCLLYDCIVRQQSTWSR